MRKNGNRFLLREVGASSPGTPHLPQVPFQNRYGAMELDNITSPESLPQGWSGAGVVRQEGKRGERVRRKRARERKRGKDLIWFL